MITLVSGLPRSGTSMMMKMLEAGGMELLTDEYRKADIDNPKGYYEFEKVKKLNVDNTWLMEAENKVIKVISQLLYDLPDTYDYKVVFVKRKFDEILMSQHKMLDRRGETPTADNDKMKEIYASHIEDIEKWLRNKKNFDVLYLYYHKIISNPKKTSKKIESFLRRDLNVKDMALAIDQKLYRNKK